jgi:hypothetical protein
MTEEETRELMGAMMVDANSDPSEISTALWEVQLAHVQCRIEEDFAAEPSGAEEDLLVAVDGLEDDLARFLSEHPSSAQRLANSLSREDAAEAAAMAETATREAERSADAALALDEATRALLSRQLIPAAADSSQRHVDVTLDAIADALGRGDVALVASALGARTKRLVRVGRDAELFESHRQLLQRLEEDESRRNLGLSATLVTHAMFTAESLRHVVQMAGEWNALVGMDRSQAALDALERITAALGPGALNVVLRIADRTPAGPPLDLLVRYVARVAPGNEQRLFELLPKLHPVLAQRLLATVLDQATPETKAMARPLLRSSNAALRCEVLAHLADSSEQLSQALMPLFTGAEQQLRLAALDTFLRHRVLSAGPALVRAVQSEAFKLRPPDEQYRVFQAIFELNPARAERLLVSVAEQHGLMVDESLDQMRGAAVRLLSERCTSAEALAAVDAAARRRPWNSTGLRADAVEAVAIIHMRRARGTGEGGKSP